MSYSLKIQDGELALGGTSIATVTGNEKLLQDLKCAILERVGTDSAHPQYGSYLDGGRKPNGVEVPSTIGRIDVKLAALEIESDLRRIMSELQGRQLARAKQDAQVYGKATLSAGEVLVGVVALDIIQKYDSLIIQIKIRSANNVEQTITVPIS